MFVKRDVGKTYHYPGGRCYFYLRKDAFGTGLGTGSHSPRIKKCFRFNLKLSQAKTEES